MKVKLLTPVLALAYSLVAGCGGGGDGGSNSPSAEGSCSVIGRGTRSSHLRIFNGEECSDNSTSAIVRLVAKVRVNDQTVTRPTCSGTLIAPDLVLTAAHCFADPGNGFPVEDFGVALGEDGNGEFVPGVSGSIPPSLHSEEEVGRLFDDAALVRLSKPLPNATIPLLYSRTAEEGEAGYVYGYGVRNDGDDASNADFTKLLGGVMTVATVTTNHIFVVYDGKGTNVCNGDSGGPILLLVNGQPALAGVVSQGSVDACQSGDTTTFTSVLSPGVFEWLQKNAPSVSSL